MPGLFSRGGPCLFNCSDGGHSTNKASIEPEEKLIRVRVRGLERQCLIHVLKQ